MRRIIFFVIAAAALSACGESMDQQNRTKTYGSGDGLPWQSHGEALPLPDGVVAQGALQRRQDRDNAPAVSRALLDRGRERYDIYCAPCHGLTGAGDGFIVQRGFPAPTPLDDARVVHASAKDLLADIGDGKGVMYGFSDRVAPKDQWAIVAYIRALQYAASHRRSAP
jgi:mono/diheme cytochrome c family protein